MSRRARRVHSCTRSRTRVSVMRAGDLSAVEDEADIAIARKRLEEIDEDPSRLLRGAELKRKLDEWQSQPPNTIRRRKP